MARMENACDIRRCGLSYVYLQDDDDDDDATTDTTATAEPQLILYHLDIYVNLEKQMFENYTESIWYLFICHVYA